MQCDYYKSTKLWDTNLFPCTFSISFNPLMGTTARLNALKTEAWPCSPTRPKLDGPDSRFESSYVFKINVRVCFVGLTQPQPRDAPETGFSSYSQTVSKVEKPNSRRTRFETSYVFNINVCNYFIDLTALLIPSEFVSMQLRHIIRPLVRVGANLKLLQLHGQEQPKQRTHLAVRLYQR